MQIPVERAETFYLPPSARRPEDWSAIPPAERVFRWTEQRQQRRVVPPTGFIIGQQAYARINHNRWVADCPCGSAQVVSPADPRMACTECGLGWVRLVFPDDPGAVEQSVSADLPHLRNWWNFDDPTNPYRLGSDDDDVFPPDPEVVDEGDEQ
ncbi:hypothetical protein AB0G76_37005 [Streptomyces asoensis]|uniref:hypothetical protein n=1 Tax=Streptomyces asoensis TaxID=249586 RepID=UPI0033E22586